MTDASILESLAISRTTHDPKPDSPRYRAIGDAVTVPVAEWIGRRVAAASAGGEGR